MDELDFPAERFPESIFRHLGTGRQLVAMGATAWQVEAVTQARYLAETISRLMRGRGRIASGNGVCLNSANAA